jgi:hypothetical protein
VKEPRTREVMMKGKHFSYGCGALLTVGPKVRVKKSRRIAEATGLAGLILDHETIHLMHPSDLETYIAVYRETFLSSPAFGCGSKLFACSVLSQPAAFQRQILSHVRDNAAILDIMTRWLSVCRG